MAKNPRGAAPQTDEAPMDTNDSNDTPAFENSTTPADSVAETTETVATASPGSEAPAAAVPEAPKTDERYKFVTHPETGAQVKRKDYILELWTIKRMSRGDIAKHLTEITGKKVVYQIVFGATKGVAGGPVPAPAAPAADAPSAPSAETPPAA